MTTKDLYVGRRRDDYTAEGIKRVPCTRCGGLRSHASFTICANGKRKVPLCRECDFALNELVLTWLGIGKDRVDALMKKYRGA